MLKIIIADDERIIRETISRLIDWSSLGLELVGQCRNGIEAYNAILDESPDIVMTDIKMPGLSGIDLVEKATAAHLNTQFIILSGYGEFDYAREAMKYGVRHYLLKPCNEQQIVSSLKEVIEDCYHKYATQQLEKQHALLQNNLRQNVIFNILSQAVGYEDKERSDLYRFYKMYLDFDQTAYQMFRLEGLREEELSQGYNALAQWLHSHAPGLALYGVYVHNNLLVFCQQYDSHADVSGELQAFLQQTLPEAAITLHSRRFPNLAQLLDDLIPRIAFYSTLVYLNGAHFVYACNYRSTLHAIKELCDSICGAPDSARRLEYLEQLQHRLSSIVEPDFLVQLSSSILLNFSSRSMFCTSAEATEVMLKLHEYHTADEIRGFLFPFLSQIVGETGKDSPSDKDFILHLQQYVRDNISNPNLTLKWIAENHLYMNVDYVSRKFVRVTGQKFSAFLTDVRIRYAKKLLSEYGTEQIHVIAEQVGCGNNPHYFSQIFKKSTGLTPSAYAKMTHAAQTSAEEADKPAP